jgi:hypothetical protein
MEKLYRSDYQGEFVVHLTNKVKGQVEEKREWVPNTINKRHNGVAVVFGNGVSRLRNPVHFDLFRHHRGGLHAAKKMTTYGCNAFYRDATPHVLIVNHPVVAKEVYNSGFANENIVVTNTKNVLRYPDKFHLIPFDPHFCAGATALYMAAFDGHNQVYFLGFDGHEGVDYNNNVYAGTNGYAARTAHMSSEVWDANVKEVFDAYNNIEFIRVMPEESMPIPESWKYAANFRQIAWRQFVSEVDLGAT